MSELERKNAIISVYDKTDIAEFADGLHELDWQIYASGGTHKEINAAGIPATDVSELVGGEAILGHKVVTLSRELAAGLLADVKDEQEMQEMKRLGLPIIHLVCQDSYPLEKEIAKPGSTPASVLAQSDIGGPNMLREAAKGRRIVLSVAEQREQVLEWLRAGKPDEEEFVRVLCARAVYEVARYTAMEAKYWNGSDVSVTVARKFARAKYGENPRQAEAALYADNREDINPLGLDQFKHVQGMELSFINETDIARLTQTSTHIAGGFERNFGEVPPMVVGVKHGNTCGAGVAETHADAAKKMLEGDTRAIFGGVVMINGEIDMEVAEVLMTHMTDGDNNRLLDGVIGSNVTDEALELLSRNKLRVVVNPALESLNEQSIDNTNLKRFIPGGVLEQPNYTFVMDLSAEYMQQHGEITEQEKRDLILAWAVGSTSNSNTITLAKDGMVIGNGVGQQDRVGAAQLAIARTTIELPTLDEQDDELVMSTHLDKDKLAGSVAYSDSFFPFPDAPMILANAGINAILTSSGSVADEKVIGTLNNAGVSLLMVPDKVGRGFFGH